MRRRPPVWLACAALAAVVEAATCLAVAALYEAAFGNVAWLSEAACVTATYAVLLVGGAAGCALASASAYAAVTRLRAPLAAGFVALVCVPLTLVAATAVYGTLVCLALV
jgi:hypothetical protein